MKYDISTMPEVEVFIIDITLRTPVIRKVKGYKHPKHVIVDGKMYPPIYYAFSEKDAIEKLERKRAAKIKKLQKEMSKYTDMEFIVIEG